MQLAIDGLLPLPLCDKLNNSESGIWKRSINFDSGGWVFVQAPSGTGKTTLLHTLYGLRGDYEGQIKWGGNVLKDMDDNRLATLRSNAISIVFQDLRLFPVLTAWENLSIKRQLADTVTEAQMDEWLNRLGIAHKKGSLAATLSYGEQQRVAIIRALLQPFEWLLMDEPFSHLDNANTAKAIGLITEVAAQRNAGLFLAGLDTNSYFTYTQTILL
jgi:ABC-type lipoprotein export system ATPase subunit